MKTKNQINTEQVPSQMPPSPSKEAYHAPQIKVHGKLERMTLQGGSPGTGGGGGGGTGNTAEE